MQVASLSRASFEIIPSFVPSRRKVERFRETAFGREKHISQRLARQQPLVTAKRNHDVVYQTIKRSMDVAGSLVFLMLFSPLLVAVYLLLFITTKGQPIFCQERIGLLGKKFRMFKFRTMCLDAEAKQQLVPNEQNGPVFKNRCDPRITRIGRWMRSFSIDELPQLFNVLRGDMALVGPRPPVAKEVVRYQRWQLDRLAVKPGLTCLWQVSGRCEIGFEDWVRMDLWYVKNQGLFTDLKLLFRTPASVLGRRGAY